MKGIPLQAYLVIDNNVLVMLTEHGCHCHANRVPAGRLVAVLVQQVVERLDLLRSFTPDGLLHCTDSVAAEYNPRAGRLGQITGLRLPDFAQIASGVCGCLRRTTTPSGEIDALRGLPAAPRRLVGPGGLSDQDLSLVALGLQLTSNDQAVYVLSNDQDLLSFVTWARTQTEVRRRWPQALKLQGSQSLAYFESAHRQCHIQTEMMKDLLMFAFREHYGRSQLAGTQKGVSIFDQLVEINDSLMQSIQIKLTLRGGVV